MSTKIYSSLPLLYISIFFACVTITVSYDVNWTVTVDTSADVDEHNWTLPITWTNPHGDTHYYIYFDITDRYDLTTRLWEDARSECQSEEFSSTEGGCYLLEVNERMETLRFLEYMNTGHYSSELWVNHYNVGPGSTRPSRTRSSPRTSPTPNTTAPSSSSWRTCATLPASKRPPS